MGLISQQPLGGFAPRFRQPTGIQGINTQGFPTPVGGLSPQQGGSFLPQQGGFDPSKFGFQGNPNDPFQGTNASQKQAAGDAQLEFLRSQGRIPTSVKPQFGGAGVPQTPGINPFPNGPQIAPPAPIMSASPPPC